MRAASERPSFRHAQQKLVTGRSQLSLVSQEPEMSSDRSDLQDPSFLARILPALAAASFLSSAGFQSVASSANPFLLKQTNPSAVDKRLDFLTGNGRLDPSCFFRVYPDSALAGAEKTGCEPSLAFQAHLSSSSSSVSCSADSSIVSVSLLSVTSSVSLVEDVS